MLIKERADVLLHYLVFQNQVLWGFFELEEVIFKLLLINKP